MLNERLKNEREKKNLTQLDVAKMIQISRQRYNNYETGKRIPDYDTLVLLANLFNVSTDYLLGRTNKKNSSNSISETQKNLFYKTQVKKASKEDDTAFLQKMNTLSPESKKELEKYLQLLKLKEEMDKTKDENSSASEKKA